MVGRGSYLTLPSSRPVASRAETMPRQSWSTSPKTTWRPFNQEVTTVVMKNWEPLLFESPISQSVASRCLIEVDLRVGAGIGHGQQTGTVVLQLEVLIGELLTVDGLTTGTLEMCQSTDLKQLVSWGE